MLIVKVPGINGLGKTAGCEKAPDAILASLSELYSNERGKTIIVDSLRMEEIQIDNSNVTEDNKLIYQSALKMFERQGKQLVTFLGGDHSVSYSLAKAFVDRCKSSDKEPCLIIFDAHPDLMEPVDANIPTHEEWLRALIENTNIKGENVLLVGVRNTDPSEREFISKNGIRSISMNQFTTDIEEACNTIMEFANGKELYLSLDIDVVDPAFAPATGYNEVGGLTSREFIYLVQRMKKVKGLCAIDLVEINPDKDLKFDNITVKLGAKVLSEII